MLPMMAIPGLVSAGVGLAQGIAGATSDRTQQQWNKKRLEELMKLQQQGQLGLSGNERRQLNAQTYQPAANAAAEARSRAEQLMAAGGQTSGADLVASQKAQQGANAQARQQAAQIVNAANLQKQAQQKNELEARLAEKSRMAQRDVGMVGDAVQDALATAAQAGVDAFAPQVGGAAPGAAGGMAGIDPAMLKKLQELGLLQAGGA